MRNFDDYFPEFNFEKNDVPEFYGLSESLLNYEEEDITEEESTAELDRYLSDPYSYLMFKEYRHFVRRPKSRGKA